MNGLLQQSLSVAIVSCHAYPRTRLVECESLSHVHMRADPCCACAPVMRTAARDGARPLHRPVATQRLLALTTPCRNAYHGRHTWSKGLCRDRETSVTTLVTQSQPKPCHETKVLLRHRAKQSLSRQRSRRQYVAIEEP